MPPLAAAARAGSPFVHLPASCRRRPCAGVVLTVEPALYIPDDEAYGPLRGIGVRIEDDIAITG